MPDFAIRPAREQDAAAIRALLSELACGQLLPGEPLSKRFWLTEDDVRRDMLGGACHCDLLWLAHSMKAWGRIRCRSGAITAWRARLCCG